MHKIKETTQYFEELAARKTCQTKSRYRVFLVAGIKETPSPSYSLSKYSFCHHIVYSIHRVEP